MVENDAEKRRTFSFENACIISFLKSQMFARCLKIAQKNLIWQKFWGFGAKIQIVLDFARNVVKWKKGDFLSDFQTLWRHNGLNC